jgi:hypothetical protein
VTQNGGVKGDTKWGGKNGNKKMDTKWKKNSSRIYDLGVVPTRGN